MFVIYTLPPSICHNDQYKQRFVYIWPPQDSRLVCQAGLYTSKQEHGNIKKCTGAVYVQMIALYNHQCQSTLCCCLTGVETPHLSQSLQQDGDAGQSLGGPLVVPVAKHQTHQLRVSGAHCLLKNCQSRKTCRQRLRVKQPRSLRPHLKWMKSRNFRRRWGGSEDCPNRSRPVEGLVGSSGSAAGSSSITTPRSCKLPALWKSPHLPSSLKASWTSSPSHDVAVPHLSTRRW